MASMYPFGGPRLREGPKNVHAFQSTVVSKRLVLFATARKMSKGKSTTAMRRGRKRDSRVPSMMQLLQGSLGVDRSHLHFDLRHWSQARGA
jgi:hypothetical protein